MHSRVAPMDLPAGAGPPAPAGAPAEIGPALFGLALTGLGVQCLLRGAPVPALEPLPAWADGSPVWAYLTGLALAAGGAAVMLGRRAPRGAPVVVGGLFAAWALLLHLAPLVAHPTDGNVWTRTFETVALGGAAWALLQPPDGAALGTAGSRSAPALAGRLAFAAALLVFGALHLVYLQFVAMLVPAWIPAKTFWAGFTGVAHIAAGLGLLTGVLARPAAFWYGVMFASWVVVVHAPRVVRAPEDPKEWASLLVALGMWGGAWLIGGRLGAGAVRPAGAAGARIRLRGRTAHNRVAAAPAGGPEPVATRP